MKDVSVVLPEGCALAAMGERANPFDAFVSNQYARLVEMPKGAVVGTSSLRREAQLRARYPHLVIKPLRGNVQTACPNSTTANTMPSSSPPLDCSVWNWTNASA